jgi:2-hydroxychromene-2-carboxylate isomerase
MALSYELYWSFRSPYSYLIVPRLVALEEEFDVRCVVRPVYPLAIRTPEFFDQRDPLWFTYFRCDIHREAAFLGMPLRWPNPDPVRMDPSTGKYAKEQPYIYRLTHLGVTAAERGRGLPFLREVSHMIWSGEIEGWHEGTHLARAAERAGLDLAALDAEVAQDSARYARIVEENQRAQRNGGHWGVPMMTFNGEPFFGQDRFAQLKWRMEQGGLRKR